MNDIRYVTIVDDHTMIRKGLVSLVNLFPFYKVLFDAADGRHFIEQLKPQHLPDIVLLDINMPHMDGYATANWIRVNHPSIKVIALSTMDAESAIIKMLRNGACGYLLKDADTDELKLALDEVMAKGFYYNDKVTRTVMRSIPGLTDEKSPVNTFVRLTDRELDFMRLACSEKTYQEIARDMNVSERTVDGYREALFKKLNVGTRVGLVLYAIKNGLVTI